MGTDVVSVRRALAAVAAALLCSPLLAACSDDEPEPLVVEPPPSPTASATAEPVPEPEPWQVRSKAGAVAFVEHWVEVFNEAGRTGDTAELSTLSSADCLTCQGAIELIDGWSAEGTTLQTKGWRVIATQIPTVQKRPPFDVAVRVDRSPQRLRSADGTIERYPGSTETYSVRLAWVDNRWSLDTFNQVT